MNFLNPLGFIAMITVPFLIMLYFLKLKRPQHEVASTLLWQKVVEDMRVNSPFQRLKKSLLLLLQLLLLLALIFALTRPFMKGGGVGSGSLIILVDTSASMNAVEAGDKTRLDLAKERVRDIVDNMSGGDEIMLVSFNNSARQIGAFTTNKRRLRDAIDQIQPTDRPTDITQALTLADSLGLSRVKPKILILSDGSFDDPNVETIAPISFEAIGSDQPNMAITSLDIRRSMRNPEDVELFMSVQNFSPEPMSGLMTLYLDDKLLDTKNFDIDGGSIKSTVFDATLSQSGEFRVNFDVDDALADDNEAYLVVAPPETRTVLLVGDNTFFLKKVFSTSRDIILREIPEDKYTPSAADDCVAVIWNIADDPQIAPTHNLYIGCIPEYEGLSLKGKSQLIPQNWDRGNLANRYIDYTNLLIEESAILTIPEDGRSIMDGLAPAVSQVVPIIAEIPNDDHLMMVVSFNPFMSDWPLRVDYPIFMHNALRRFDQYASTVTRTNVRVGETLTLKEPGAEPGIRRPDGEIVTLTPTASGTYAYSDIDVPGVYTIMDGSSASQAIAANIFNPTESELKVVAQPAVGNQALAAVESEDEIDREYTKYLLMAALALLLLEWLIYHRRIFT